jgi:serine protease Do
LPRVVAATPVGKKVKLAILRNGKQEEVEVTIERLKDAEEGSSAADTTDRLGMTVNNVTAELAARMGLKETKGVVVVAVTPGGAAEEAGIARGDIVREINGAKIANADDYGKAVSSLKKGEVMRLLLRRGESSLFVALKAD